MRRTIAALALLALSAPARAELIAEQNGLDVMPMFAARGFRDVEITARHIDRIEAEACRGAARWRTTLLLLSGRVKAHERLGDCVTKEEAGVERRAATAGRPAAWDAEDRAMRALERVGYTGVKLRRWGREGWRGTACRDGRLREVRVSARFEPAAPLRAMRDCPPGRDRAREYTAEQPEPPIRHVRDVKSRLVKRGYRQVGRIEIENGAFHARACTRGWRFVVTMKPDGAISAQRNLGERCEEPESRVSLTLPVGSEAAGGADRAD